MFDADRPINQRDWLMSAYDFELIEAKTRLENELNKLHNIESTYDIMNEINSIDMSLEIRKKLDNLPCAW